MLDQPFDDLGWSAPNRQVRGGISIRTKQRLEFALDLVPRNPAIFSINQVFQQYWFGREYCGHIGQISYLQKAGNRNVSWNVGERVIEYRGVSSQPATQVLTSALMTPTVLIGDPILKLMLERDRM